MLARRFLYLPTVPSVAVHTVRTVVKLLHVCSLLLTVWIETDNRTFLNTQWIFVWSQSTVVSRHALPCVTIYLIYTNQTAVNFRCSIPLPILDVKTSWLPICDTLRKTGQEACLHWCLWLPISLACITILDVRTNVTCRTGFDLFRHTWSLQTLLNCFRASQGLSYHYNQLAKFRSWGHAKLLPVNVTNNKPWTLWSTCLQ